MEAAKKQTDHLRMAMYCVDFFFKIFGSCFDWRAICNG